MLPYISECENRQGIVLPKKFPHYLREIIQNFYYIPLKKVGNVTLGTRGQPYEHLDGNDE